VPSFDTDDTNNGNAHGNGVVETCYTNKAKDTEDQATKDWMSNQYVQYCRAKQQKHSPQLKQTRLGLKQRTTAPVTKQRERSPKVKLTQTRHHGAHVIALPPRIK
jgi:hypothetical protein